MPVSPSRAEQPNVLLVDDRTENLLALEAVLAPLPCKLVSVTSGQEALRRLLHDEFALILLDVQMPELDGFETAEYIKRRKRTRAVPIIFVTAISKEEHHVFRGYAWAEELPAGVEPPLLAEVVAALTADPR